MTGQPPPEYLVPAGVQHWAPPAFAPAPLPPPPPPRRRHRGAFWVAVLAAVAALVAGTVVAVTTYLGAATADAAATAYFRDLGKGDAAAALALGDLPTGARTFLTSDVLAAALRLAPISNVRVLSVDQHGGSANVAMQYQLGYQNRPVLVTDQVAVTKDGRRWRLDATAATVRLSPEAARDRLTVVGVAVPSGPTLFFPGALPISVDTPNLSLGPQVVHLTGSVPGDIQPTVSAEGIRAVGDGVAAAVRACISGRWTSSCPASEDPRIVPGTIRGHISSNAAPDISVSLAARGDGLIEIGGTVKVTGSYQKLDFNNRAVTRSGTLSLVIDAQCYATDPARLAWSVTR